MDISFEQEGEYVIFRIDNVETKYEPVLLKTCFYQRDGASYIKRFPKDTKDLDIIQRNYARDAELMFRQLCEVDPVPWEKGLGKFLMQVAGVDINWWLAGSCAACVRGIPFKPHDIDIMIGAKDVDTINDLFIDYIVEPIVDSGGWVTKDFGVVFLHARIDIASDPQDCLDHPEPVDCGPYAKEHLEDVLWNGYRVRVPPVNLLLNANKQRERIDRVRLLEEYCDKHK